MPHTISTDSGEPTSRDTQNFGGWRILADAAALSAVPTAMRVQGMRARLISTGVEYVLEADLTTWAAQAELPVPSGVDGRILMDVDGVPTWTTVVI